MYTLEHDAKIQDIKGKALATSLSLIQEESCICWDAFKTETDALESGVIERDISCNERAKRGADESQETANEPQVLLNDTSTDPLRNSDDLLADSVKHAVPVECKLLPPRSVTHTCALSCGCHR